MNLKDIDFLNSNQSEILRSIHSNTSSDPEKSAIVPVYPVLASKEDVDKRILSKPGILLFDNTKMDTLFKALRVRTGNLYIPEAENKSKLVLKAIYSPADIILRTSLAQESIVGKIIKGPTRFITKALISALGDQLLELETPKSFTEVKGVEVNPQLTIGRKGRQAVVELLGAQLLGFRLPGFHFKILLQQGYQDVAQQERALDTFQYMQQTWKN